MSTGYNWRNTLTHYASISGVLAGFCVAFIGIVLGWSVADTEIYEGITYGQIAVLLFGISTGLFVSSSEFFLHAKNFDIFELSEDYRDWLQTGFPNEDWDKIWIDNTKECRANEKYGRLCYNLAIFVLFIGLFFAIAPYSLGIAVIVSGFGIILELWQLRRSFFKFQKRAIETEGKRNIGNIETDREEEIRENLRTFVYGVLMGVVGNFLVSYVVEHDKAVGFVERTKYAFLVIASAVIFFQILQITGRDLEMPEGFIRFVRILKYISVVLVALVWALEFLIIPAFW